MISLLKILKTRLVPRPAEQFPQCVAICIEHDAMNWVGVSQSDVDFLVERLQGVMENHAAEYDGQEDIDGEIRLYFFAADARQLAQALLPVLHEITWCRGARMKVNSGTSGHWDEQKI